MSLPNTGSIDFLGQALVLRSERQRLIASNIANADTPGYVARDFDFAQALREATAGGRDNSLGGPIAGDLVGDAGAGSPPRLNYALSAQTSLDNNTVDMDRERAAFADNALKFESTLRFIGSKVSDQLAAMKTQ
ncbi:MAG: flagellar basal body rod protein FlgB [Burkholderiales bacterium]|nr:flagellar basal body rod protein FlgB [Burkholderiales bacterium]MDE2452492.1 flagellar basal body rod protein FlgB [Burkholderiales bacterium]